ncbi:type IV pilus twitching motility protein PilT [Candidatus Falkowbacteria bacterium]|nr:type IV pilus twitching motility protein PilT [Candidatus Falkowbacteria bacterium]
MTIYDIFQSAIAAKASDVHLVVGMPPMLRIDGELIDLDAKTLTAKEVESLSFDLISADEKRRFIESKELDFGYETEDRTRFRVNLFYERGNVGMVARVISNCIPTLEDISTPEIIFELLNLNQGLILVTGPTGCGKSTTLAAMINYINNKRRANIITLEDPIEYSFKSGKSVIVQRQLGSDMTSFSEGLKHALRQDPNVIMVGEMRDLETIATTITLAETGHLVLATLHTYSASQTVDRIIDIFPPHQQNQVRMQLSTTLAGIISQRLIPKQSGGRVAAREIMINIPAVSNLIRENKIAQLRTVIETNFKKGMVSMDQDLKRLFSEGVITKEVAQSYMENPEFLEKFRLM